MSTPDATLEELLEKWVNQQVSAEEEETLLGILNDPGQQQQVKVQMQAIWSRMPQQSRNEETDTLYMVEQIVRQFNAEKEIGAAIQPYRKKRRWWIAAAIIFAVMITATAIFVTSDKPVQKTREIVKDADIAPGKNGAILTLEDGTKVVLDSAANGVVAIQNGSQVLLTNGKLEYDPTGAAGTGVQQFNTLTTPKGHQYSIVLPDGTRIWLNAASSIRYPTVFTGNARRIEVSGEVYIEAASDTRKPFYVSVQHQAEIAVLGTSFNVNAYDNEVNFNTTLIDGSVQVKQLRSDGQTPLETGAVVLKPGQQARIENLVSRTKDQPQQRIKIIQNADVDKVLAWKNGTFNFNDASLEQVMKQLERWYDIEVVYEKGVPDIHFVGELSRDLSLNGLLRALKTSEVNFRLQGRQLIVTL